MTITGSQFAITAPAGATFTLSSASWCVNSALTKTDPSADTGLTGSSPSVKKGTAQNVGYVTVYSVTTAAPAPTCYDSTRSVDVTVTAVDTLNGLHAYSSTDGSCKGVPFAHLTVVSALDLASASLTCLSLVGIDAVNHPMIEEWPAMPADWWQC